PADLSEVDREMLGQIEALENRIDLIEMIQGLNRSRIPDKLTRFGDYGFAAGEVRHGSQDLLPAISKRQLLQQCFKAGLILHIEKILQLRNLLRRQFHTVNDAAEEVHATEIDLK